MPLIVEDNFNTADMPTTAGSLSLKGSIPASDAFQVRKLTLGGYFYSPWLAVSSA